MGVLSNKVSTSFSEYYKKYPQEKIFLHSDQNVYLGGQTCWYKAYTQAYGKPSQLSKIIYVRLSDAKGKLIKQDKLPLIKGSAYGNIQLTDSLPTGWYQLRAFTAWMLNFEAGGTYHQNIFIRNIHDTVSRHQWAESAKTYHINFFPEGGDLVDGNLCNVAFKATDENGLPAKVYGEVIDDTRKKVVKLITVHDGMGSFEIEAFANSSYIAQVHFPDNSIQRIALPKVKKTGISMRVNPITANEIELRITYSGQTEEHKDILIAAMQNNGLSVMYPLTLSRGGNIFGFKKSDFSTGILRLTVMDSNGLPLAERVVFVDNNDQLKFSLSKDSISFDPKSRNVFTLNLKDHDDKLNNTNFSVSVTDAGVGNEWSDNISSYFLMSSELKGYIYQPAYYFSNNCDTLLQQLDMVMLTNGWRHFRLDSLANNKPAALKYYVESSQFIAGKIENYNPRDNPAIKFLITNSDSSKNVLNIEPDSSGTFVLNGYTKQGTATIDYTIVNRKNKRLPWKISFFKPNADTAHFSADIITQSAEIAPVIGKTFLDSVAIERKVEFVTKGILLKGVNIKDEKLTPTELLVKSHVKHMEADRAFDFDMVNVTHPPLTVLNYLWGRIPGLKIVFEPGVGWHFAYRGPSAIGGDKSAPVFYIDEVIASLDETQDVPPSEIALIRFVPPPVWFAPLNGGAIGAIMVYTKRFGDEKGSGSGRAFNQYTFNGYSVTREFSSPDYSAPKQIKQPDYRTTLYWSHDLSMDDQGNIKIRFYNSDRAKKYRVIVQGMDADGKVGYLSETF